MDRLTLDDGLTVRTAFPEKYRELVEQRKLFTFMYDLFLLALMVGLLRGSRSEARKEGDIVKVGQIKSEETKRALEVVCCLLPGEDDRSRWNQALAYADGGLEQLWQQFQTLGHLDILRLVAEAKAEWPDKLSEVFKMPVTTESPQPGSRPE